MKNYKYNAVHIYISNSTIIPTSTMDDFNALLTKENILRNRLDRFIENGRKTAIAKRTHGFFEGKIVDLQKLWEDYCAIDLSINEMLVQNKKAEKCDYVEEEHYG